MLIELIIKHRLKILIVAGLGVAGVAIWLVFFYIINLSVLGINPNLNRVSYLSPYLDVSFNKTISLDSLELEDPDNIVSKTDNNDDKTLRINFLQALQHGKEYTLTIKSLSSDQDNSKLYNYVIRFTPLDNDTLITEDELNTILERQENKPVLTTDPMVDNTPYSTNEFYISASEKTYMDNHDGTGEYKVIEIKVNLFPDRDKLNSNYNKTINDIKIKANTYIESILKTPVDKLDIAKYQITYVVQ